MPDLRGAPRLLPLPVRRPYHAGGGIQGGPGQPGRGAREGAQGARGKDHPPKLKGERELKSKDMCPEPLEKGILRRKHEIYVNKDGTIRFDLTDVPLTHFRPREIGLSVEKALELGYDHDIYDRPLTDPEQLCELKVQDIVPSISCGEFMVRVTGFIDDLLERFYELPRFYNAQSKEDLIGHLAIGLAPHTSGGILCRMIGFTKASVCFGHPFFHAAKRRNADGDEDSVVLLLDGLLNFSRSYLPDSRGGLMDAPLVLALRLDPNEVDKEPRTSTCTGSTPWSSTGPASSSATPRTSRPRWTWCPTASNRFCSTKGSASPTIPAT